MISDIVLKELDACLVNGGSLRGFAKENGLAKSTLDFHYRIWRGAEKSSIWRDLRKQRAAEMDAVIRDGQLDRIKIAEMFECNKETVTLAAKKMGVVLPQTKQVYNVGIKRQYLTKDEAIKEMLAGAAVGGTARRHGVSHKTARKWATEGGVIVRLPRIDDKPLVVQALLAGGTVSGVARQFSLKYPCVAKWAAQYGVGVVKRVQHTAKEDVLKDLREGARLVDVCKKYGISNVTGWTWMNLAGMARQYPSTIKAAIADVESGLSLEEACQKNGVGRKALSTWLARSGIEGFWLTSKARQAWALNKVILSDVKSGFSVALVCRTHGVSSDKVRRLIKKAGLKTPGQLVRARNARGGAET